MAVITISRTLGSRGDEIAQILCRELGYQLFEKGLIIQAAVEAGIGDKEIQDLSEDTYKVHGFLDRLFSRSSFFPYMGMWPEDLTAMAALQEEMLNEETLLELVQSAVEWAYHLDNFIIVGRGSQVLLKGRPDVLHVRLDAPVETRVQCVLEQFGQSAKEPDLPERVRRMVHERDTASAQYIKTFYHVDWADPQQYHLVLNTGLLSDAQVVQVIKDITVTLPNLDRSPEAGAAR